MSDAPDPQQFFGERFPAQLNRALVAQEQAATSAQRALDGMRAVDATLCFRIEGGGTWYVNVEKGRAAAGDGPSHPPFLTLALESADYRPLWREAGDDVLGFLGGLSGTGAPLKLTRNRVEQIAAVGATLRFELTGAGGFRLLARLGPGDPAEPADTTIRVDAAAYRALREGRLEPQEAFLAGHIQVEGDLQHAMQLALAVLSPD